MRKNIRKIIHVILIALMLVVFSIFPVSDIRAGETRLTIIHGSNLNGHLVPCPTWGNTSLGGLARRGAFADRIRTNGEPVLVVDSGRLFTDIRISAPSELSLKKALLISRAYKHMNVAAVNLGDPDLILGLSFLRQESFRGLPLISANLIDPSQRSPIFPPYVIKKVDGIRVAFFGLLSPDISTAVRKVIGKKVLVGDPVETARSLVERLRGEADIIILLSDLGLEGDKNLVRKVPGIHFVLGGREGQYLRSPVWEGETPILQSYIKGMYAGSLQITFTHASSPFRTDGRTNGNRFHWTLMPLDGSIAEDKVISEWIRKAGLEKLRNLR